MTGRIVGACVGAGLLGMFAGPALTARAGTVDSWLAGNSGDFLDGTNWADGSAPGAEDSAVFAGPATDVQLSSDVLNRQLIITGTSISLSANASPVHPRPIYTLQDSAALSSGRLVLGPGAYAVEVRTNGELSLNSSTLEVQWGSRVSAGSLRVLSQSNSSSSSAMVTIGTYPAMPGDTAALDVAGDAFVASQGPGNWASMYITYGSNASIGGTLNLATTDTGNAEIMSWGSSTMTGDVNLGTAGAAGQTGMVMIYSGSSWTQRDSSALTLGAAWGSQGSIQVQSQASFTSGSGPIRVNSGWIELTYGGIFNANGDILLNPDGGRDGCGDARLHVDGAGSRFTQNGARSITVGSATASNASPGRGIIEVGSYGVLDTGSGTTTVNRTGMINVLYNGYMGVHGDLVINGGQVSNAGTLVLGQDTTLLVKNGGSFDNGGAQFTLGHGQAAQVTSGGVIKAGSFAVGTDGDASLVVDGTSAQLSSNSSFPAPLTVGGNGSAGSATFRNMASATFSWVDVGYAYWGSGLGSGSLTVDSGAKFSFDGMDIVAGEVSVSGAGSQLKQTNAANSIYIGAGPGNGISATLTVGPGGTLTAGGQTMIGDTGTLKIQGGTANLGQIQRIGSGQIQFDSGSLSYQGGLEVASTSDALFGPALQLSAGRTLTNTGTTHIASDGQFTLSGGSLKTSDLTNEGVFSYTGGTFSANTLKNQPGGTMTIGNNATLNVGTAWVQNYGELTFGGGTAALNTAGGSGPVENRGVIRGDGRIGASLWNAQDGELRAENSNRLLLNGATNTNDGRITLSYGGTVETPKGLQNYSTGVISGDGVLRAGQFPYPTGGVRPTGAGIQNFGKMNFSGTTKVYGDVWTEGNGSTDIIVSGGATLTFFDDVFMKKTTGAVGQPEIRAGAGSRVVYFGLVKGDVNLTGTGVHSVEGTLSPGFSPGYGNFSGTSLELTSSGTFGFDLAGVLPMNGDVASTTGHYSHWDIQNLILSEGGTLAVNLVPTVAPHVAGAVFAPRLGDQFTLMTWTQLSGDAGGVSLDFTNAHLVDGLSWKADWGQASNGSLVLTVVPEPACLMALAGLALPMLARRQRRPETREA